MSPVQQVAGDRTTGVRAGEVERVLDLVALKQLRLETAGAAYTSFMARFAGQLDKLFGAPGEAGALDTNVNTFIQSLQALASDSGNFSARSTVLSNAGVLASQIGRLSESVQALRTEAEGRIGLAVDRANELLSGISEVNARIVANQTSSDPALLDERDRMINELSQLMDVQTFQNPNGSVNLMTTAGLTLFNGVSAIKLSFDGRTTLSPQAQYSTDSSQRGVGTITAISPNGVSMDVIANGMIRSGEIAAAIEMRDHTLVQAQRQLDELAAGLARALSDRQVSGTAVGSGFDVDFTALQPGNTVTLDYTTSGGVARKITLVGTLGAAPANISPGDVGDPNALVFTVDLNDIPGSLAALAPQLAAQGITVTNPSGNTLRFDDGTSDVTAATATVTVTTLNSSYPQLPFFVDSGFGNAPFTGSFEGGSHLTGLAQRLAVNPALLANPDQLVVYEAGTPQGDTVRPQFILDALTKTNRSFAAASGIGGSAPFSSTVTGFARRIVETQGANAETANRLNEGQSVALAAIESRFAETSGVNIDQEMAQLVQLQTAYGANARVMTAVRDMMDMLMRM
jgi:flagellar hook-associated protein 1 FlgK